MKKRPLGGSLCVAMLLTSPARAAPAPSPDELFTRGEAKLAAGDRHGGIADLLQAHADYGDPLKYRTERGDLVGIVRSELMDLYRETGDPTHLCRIRGLLVAHVEGLLAALGPEAVVGSTELLREAGELLAARHPMTRCACDAWRPAQRPKLLGAEDPVRVAVPKPALTLPSSRPESPRAAPKHVAGSVLVGVGAGLVGLLGVTLGSYGVHHAEIRRIDADGRIGRPLDEREFLGHVRDARWARGASIGLGIAGAAVLAAGVGLLVSHRRDRRAGLHLDLGPHAAGLSWHMSF
jgi:hypothetical protein